MHWVSSGSSCLQVIATVCMFLAGKVEETPKLLQNVICVAYEIRHRKDPAAVQRIKMKVRKESNLALFWPS